MRLLRSPTFKAMPAKRAPKTTPDKASIATIARLAARLTDALQRHVSPEQWQNVARAVEAEQLWLVEHHMLGKEQDTIGDWENALVAALGSTYEDAANMELARLGSSMQLALYRKAAAPKSAAPKIAVGDTVTTVSGGHDSTTGRVDVVHQTGKVVSVDSRNGAEVEVMQPNGFKATMFYAPHKDGSFRRFIDNGSGKGSGAGKGGVYHVLGERPPTREEVISGKRSNGASDSTEQATKPQRENRFTGVPHSDEMIRRRAASLVVGISRDQRQAVREAILARYTREKRPETLVRDLSRTVGLDPRRARALRNFEDGLRASAAKPARVDAQVDRYRDELLQNRAETIARTESVAVENAAKTEAWEVAADAGDIPGTSQMEWVTTSDPCEYCQELDGERVDVGESFNSSRYGPVDHPPLHPNCYCTLVLRAL